MAKKVSAMVLRAAGTNCDLETAFAFKSTGAEVDLVHINQLVRRKINLRDYQILALPGGFSYGDDAGAGRILANELRFKLQKDLKRFIDDGKLIIGICNGFQILVKSGLLPGNVDFKQEATLTTNDSAKFEDRWVYLRKAKNNGKESRCIWTKNIKEMVYFPVAHGEGKFVTGNKGILGKLKGNNQIVFQYCSAQGKLSAYPDNPNGSLESIAGICDITGRIFGLMPHPERHFLKEQHPQWTRFRGLLKYGDGFAIFKNGVDYVKQNL
ncbi:MAG: phosphoribosylformylglycinamidine synthase I [Candidatus Omnitrophota bacterium]|nr:phosphoribosylformylglycinamidine synthase I [Candidatus Omnitrophota bacterium]